MKKIIIFFFAAIILCACKKEKQPEKQILISAEYSDGLLIYGFEYSPENQLSRISVYDNSKPGNPLSSYYEMEYNTSDHLSLMATYAMPGNVGKSRIKLTHTPGGKIDSIFAYDLQGSDPGKPFVFGKYNYNGQNKLSQVIIKDKNEKLVSQDNYSYYPDGNLHEVREWEAAGALLYQTGKDIFSFPGTKYPPGTAQLRIILGEFYYGRFFNESIQSYSYSQAGVITRNLMYQMSGREYNADGSLKKQVLTLKKIKPAGSDDVIQKRYEYITQ